MLVLLLKRRENSNLDTVSCFAGKVMIFSSHGIKSSGTITALRWSLLLFLAGNSNDDNVSICRKSDNFFNPWNRKFLYPLCLESNACFDFEKGENSNLDTVSFFAGKVMILLSSGMKISGTDADTKNEKGLARFARSAWIKVHAKLIRR